MARAQSSAQKDLAAALYSMTTGVKPPVSGDEAAGETKAPAAVPAAPPPIEAPKPGLNDLLITLGTALAGGVMGGSRGAILGAKSGVDAVGNDLSKRENQAAAAQAARTAEVQRQRQRGEKQTDAIDLETIKAGLKPEKEKDPKPPRTQKYDDEQGNERLGVLDDNSKLIKSKDDEIIGRPKPEKDPNASPKEIRDALKHAGDSFQVRASPYREAMDAAKQSDTLADLAKTNPMAAGAVVSKLARAAGEKGVLSDADISRFGGSPSLFARLERLIGKSTSGEKLTDDDIKFARELAVRMKKESEIGLDRVADDYTARHIAIYGGDAPTVYEQITGTKKGKRVEPVAGGDGPPTPAAGAKVPAPAPAQKPTHEMSIEEMKAELDALETAKKGAQK